MGNISFVISAVDLFCTLTDAFLNVYDTGGVVHISYGKDR